VIVDSDLRVILNLWTVVVYERIEEVPKIGMMMMMMTLWLWLWVLIVVAKVKVVEVREMRGVVVVNVVDPTAT
jgi:hypothetical protein